MHARVTTAYGPRGADKGAESTRIHNESVVPEIRQHAGYKGTLLLVDRTVHKGIQITLWETEDHSKAVEQQGDYRKQIGKFSHLSAAPFEEDYEVAVLAVEGGEATAQARVTVFFLQPDADQEELIRIFRDDVLAEMRQLPGSKGALLLLDRAAGRALSMGLWESEANMRAAEQSGTYQKQLAKLTHLFTTPPLREILEVAYLDVEGDHHLSAQDNARLIQTLLDAFNAKDPDRYVALSTADFEVLDVPSGMTLKGPDGHRQFVQRWMTAFPDGQVQATSLFATEDQGHLEYIARGTNTGPFPYASGQIPPTGRRVEFRVCAGLQFREGKVARIHYYYDLLSVLQQLGLVPTASGELVPIS